MFAARWVRLGWLVPAALISALAVLPSTESTADEGNLIQIALPSSLFRDFPKATVDLLMPTFNKLMESQTGMKGKIIVLGANEVGSQLADNKVQLAVFHGYEFAWAQAKHANLKPLVVAIKKDSTLSAQIVVAADSKIDKLGDLQGQTLAVPRGTPEHCRLFLARRIRGIGHRQEKFFKDSTTPAHVAAALDDVASGKAKVTVVDSVAWDNYQWMNPARAGKLRTLLKSESFPAGVVAYKEGGVSEANLKKFKEGLTTAHQRAEGLQLMMLLKLTRFDGVPPTYQQSLMDIAKAYPPPIGGDEP